MTTLLFDDFSLALTAFFMKIIGLWFTDNRSERWFRRVGMICTMCGLSCGVYLQTTGMYNNRNDFPNLLFDLCNLMSVIVPMSKFLILLWRRKKLFRLILYMVQNFFNASYDKYEVEILNDCKRKCKFFVCFFVCFTDVTVMSYVIPPLIVNLGKNESERIFPFKMWVNLPIQKTPYFEIIYTVQSLSVYMTGRAYFCIENILCIVNLHLAGQFRILQYRLSDKYMRQNQMKDDHESKNILYLVNNAYDDFKSCIRQHQALIQYSKEVEGFFSPVALVQVLAFSILICLDGYQVLLVELWQRRVICFFHSLATVCQLLMFSYSCDCIIRESTKLGTAACSGPWLLLPATKRAEDLKKDMIMVIMRSSKPSCISGCGFFEVSLETCTKVLTTAGSYFTLLQQAQEDVSS